MVAQVQSSSSDHALAPNERAFEAYRLVEIDGISTRAAARHLGLSQTRVIQLRDAVEQWVARQPSATAGLTKQQRIQAAEYKAGLRLDRLYSLAIKAFQQSQGTEVVAEEMTGGSRTVRTRISQGNTRYLQMAMRIAAVQSRIPATALGYVASDAEELVGCDAADHAVIPPEEDCSLESSEQSISGDAADSTCVVNGEVQEDCSDSKGGGDDANSESKIRFAPVQPASVERRATGVVQRPLSRKERKRRARMLATRRGT